MVYYNGDLAFLHDINFDNITFRHYHQREICQSDLVHNFPLSYIYIYIYMHYPDVT